SGKDEKQDVVDGLEAGADDYLTKPFDVSELRARLRAGNRVLTLQNELIQAREALRFQATHDDLTSLWSHSATLLLLNGELERGLRSRTPTGVLMIDLDHFKSVNDTFRPLELHGRGSGENRRKGAPCDLRKTDFDGHCRSESHRQYRRCNGLEWPL